MFCAVHFGGGVVGVLTVPLFSYEYGVLYHWDTKSAYVSTGQYGVLYHWDTKSAYVSAGQGTRI